MINSKEKIIEYFNSGIKNTKDFKIGIEHEKFLFNIKNNNRVNYLKIKEMFAELLEFGWNPILEKGNIIGLNKGGIDKRDRWETLPIKGKRYWSWILPGSVRTEYESWILKSTYLRRGAFVLWNTNIINKCNYIDTIEEYAPSVSNNVSMSINVK